MVRINCFVTTVFVTKIKRITKTTFYCNKKYCIQINLINFQAKYISSLLSNEYKNLQKNIKVYNNFNSLIITLKSIRVFFGPKRYFI